MPSGATSLCHSAFAQDTRGRTLVRGTLQKGSCTHSRPGKSGNRQKTLVLVLQSEDSSQLAQGTGAHAWLLLCSRRERTRQKGRRAGELNPIRSGGGRCIKRVMEVKCHHPPFQVDFGHSCGKSQLGSLTGQAKIPAFEKVALSRTRFCFSH